MWTKFRRKINKLMKKENQGKAQSILEQRAGELMKVAGWEYETAKAALKHANKAYGIPYKNYIDNKLYMLSDDELKKWTKKKSGKSSEKKLEKSIQRLVELTGWKYEYAKAAILEAEERTGCTPKEYVLYKFYERNRKEQEEIFVAHESLQIRAKFDTNKDFEKMLLDKEATNNFFAEYLNRKWCVNTKISKDEFIQKFDNSERIIYKPIHGNRGKGVEAFYINKENIEPVYEELAALPEGVVEEFVRQHPEMNRLCPESVNTLRIVTVSSKTKQVTPDGKHLDLAYVALRIGGGKSVVDNFHSGGMVAAVDVETGMIVTDGADMEGNVFVTHPTTGCRIKGFEIPFFKEAMEMVLEACESKSVEGYIGWDVAISETGPTLIEVNVRPGVVLLSTPWTTVNKGMRSVMKKYLDA